VFREDGKIAARDYCTLELLGRQVEAQVERAVGAHGGLQLVNAATPSNTEDNAQVVGVCTVEVSGQGTNKVHRGKRRKG
jgi:hypothetical protein